MQEDAYPDQEEIATDLGAAVNVSRGVPGTVRVEDFAAPSLDAGLGSRRRNAMTSYQLKPHVRACREGGYIVFLDLRQDRYWSIRESAAPTIRGLLERGETQRSGERLLQLGLIEPAGGAWAPIAQRSCAPDARLVPPADVKPSLSDLTLCAIACWQTSRSLSLRRLDLTLERLAQLKARARAVEIDAERLVATFEAFRPWYPRPRVCLFDALALFRFMLMRGAAPSLVFGVRTAPFAAHCWVEWRGMLLGDSSDHCASFTPIAWV